MRLSPSAFLWAAFSHQLFVTTSAGQQFGRFGNRFRRSNISVSSEVQDASPSPTDSLWTDASVSATGDSNRHSVTAVDTPSKGVHATTSLPGQDSGGPYTPSSSSGDPYTWGGNHTSLAPNSTSSMTTPSSFSNSRTLSTRTLSTRTLSTRTKSRPSSSTTTSSSSSTTITSISLDPTDECFSTDKGAPTTVFSLIYTETITWYGSPEDYTGIEDVTPTACHYETETPVILISPVLSTATTSRERSKALPQTSTMAISAPIETYTFVTTAKHPSVYYTSSSVPDYGGSHPLTLDEHSSVKGKTASVPDYKTTAAQQVQESSSTDVRVVVRPTEVVIGTLTVTNNPASPTTNTVTVGTDVFTVGPSSIVGAGATITRSGAVNNPAITTTIGGVGIVVSSTQAVIDGSTFSIGSTPTTQTVRGQTITVGPGGVSISGVTVPVVSGTSQTQVIVAGAELITAIGPSVVVVDGTSYTYGQGSATITKVIDDDTIYIGPSGVVVDGTTLGGITVVNSKTQYQIVGGVTISELGASVVVIEGTTWTIGPGTGTTTTVIGGETITIGPSGVEVGTTMTLSYPFGPTSTTTIHPGSAATTAEASATAVASDDEEDSGLTVGMRRNFVLALFTTCIAIGVGVFGYIF